MRIIESKIKRPAELVNIMSGFRKQGKKIVFTNGCFDILHYGHVNYLQSAKEISDILIVAINSDSSVRRLKGKKKPVINLKNRMRVIAALESVDFVTCFTQDTPLNLIKLLRPAIVVKGRDWNKNKIVGKDVVESYGGEVITLPFIKGLSTSKIIKGLSKKMYHRVHKA